MRKKKDSLRAVFQDGLLALQSKTNLQLLIKVALPMSKENDKTELLNPDDEIVRLRQELKAKEQELKLATMARDAYERMIVIAEEKYAIPIRKNSDAK